MPALRPRQTPAEGENKRIYLSVYAGQFRGSSRTALTGSAHHACMGSAGRRDVSTLSPESEMELHQRRPKRTLSRRPATMPPPTDSPSATFRHPLRAVRATHQTTGRRAQPSPALALRGAPPARPQTIDPLYWDARTSPSLLCIAMRKILIDDSRLRVVKRRARSGRQAGLVQNTYRRCAERSRFA